LQKNIRAIMPDVISVCDDGIKGFFIPGIIGKKIPVIYERHASIMLNTNQLFTGAIKRYIMRIRAKDFQKFVVLTNLGLKEWNTSNSIVISNPLSFYPANSSNLRNKTVIAAGTHSYIKGYDLLLKTWKIVTEKYPDWKLNIYGKIDISETFIKLANKLGLTDYIHFYAPVLNLEDAYMQASVMVLSSRSEGFGNVLTEAMACGLPCISFDSLIGPMEIITNGKDGFLVKKNSVKELAEKIIYLIENEDRRREMGQAAKENVKKYLPEDILLQWKLLFEQVVNEY
jgi:glycosyltransferase involved in cell wall biosynthesis